MVMSLVMLIPDNLTTLITYCTVVESFFTTLSCGAVLWLRYKKPDLPRPIKVSDFYILVHYLQFTLFSFGFQSRFYRYL